MWLVFGRSESRTVVPIHELVNYMEPDFIEVLPAIHTLTGCDTTIKVGTKNMAIKEGVKNGCSFGRDPLNIQMIRDFLFPVFHHTMLTPLISFDT